MKNLQRYFFYFVAVWCVICLFIRCYSNLAGLQTGRSVGKGNVELAASRNYVQKAPDIFGDDQPYENYVEEELVTHDFDIKVGVANRIDVGLSIGESKAGLNTKVNLIGNDGPFALALGLSTGFTGYYPYWQGNIFASVHPLNKLSLYASPGFSNIKIGENNSIYNTEKLSLIGANFGLLFGDKLQAGIDCGLYKLDVGTKTYGVKNIALGLKIKLGKDGFQFRKKD